MSATGTASRERPDTGTPRPRRGRRGRLGWLVAGEAGAAIAWVLAAAALLTAFLATAAPREAAVSSARALRQTLAGVNPAAAGITITGQWQPFSAGPSSVITPAEVTALPARIARLMQPPVDSPPAQRWGGFPAALTEVTNPARSAVLQVPPTVEVAYRSDLTRHSRLVAGRLPSRAFAGRGGATLEVAVTPAVAARFSLRTGSVVRLVTGTRLVVTAIIAPADPAQPYWTADPLQAVPEVQGGDPVMHWVAGVFIGPSEVRALQQVAAGQFVNGTWFLPLRLRGITPATLPGLLAGVTRVLDADMPAGIHPGGLAFSQQVDATSTLAGNLSGFLAQQQATSAVGSLIVAGLLGSGLVLLLICARMAAEAYRPELALLRVRGGSTRQAAGRILARAALITVPAAAAGGVAGALAVPRADVRLPWLPAAAVAVALSGALTVIAAGQQRRARLSARGERSDAATAAAQRSPRRAVAESLVILLAAGGLATLRLTAGSGQSDTFATVSPVLAAVAASLLAARLYPLPVRALLGVAAARRGPVGFLGLAQAARARGAAVLPVLALVLTLTVTAFAAMISGSVAAGQEAASWQQVGADAGVQAPGNNVITTAARRAVARVPGVTGTAAVYTATAFGPFGALVQATGGPVVHAGLAVVSPGPYAALAARTPWPGFPAGLLRPGAVAGSTGGHGVVPVLASPRVAAALASGHGPAVLELDGITIRIRVQSVLAATPAMPGGGTFVVLPQWAAAQLPSIPGPDLLLATGPGTGSRAFRAAVQATVPGAAVVLRQQVLRGLRTAPAPAAADHVVLLGVWAAAALIVMALLLGLAASAASRDRLARRMLALGMATGQARALALTETLPLLAAGILGMVAAAVALALLAGPALNLAAFAGGAGVVAIRLGVAALALPAAGAVVAALIIVGAQTARATRRTATAAVAREEAS